MALDFLLLKISSHPKREPILLKLLSYIRRNNMTKEIFIESSGGSLLGFLYFTKQTGKESIICIHLSDVLTEVSSSWTAWPKSRTLKQRVNLAWYSWLLNTYGLYVAGVWFGNDEFRRSLNGNGITGKWKSICEQSELENSRYVYCSYV